MGPGEDATDKGVVMALWLVSVLELLVTRPRPLVSWRGALWGFLWLKVAGLAATVGAGVALVLLGVVYVCLLYVMVVIEALAILIC